MNSAVETKILDAAFKVIDQYTISGTRMHLIAQECGMAQSNLHYHFKTKKDLLIALLNYIQHQFNESRCNAMNQCPNTLRGQLSGFFQQKKNIIQEQPQYDRVQMDYWSQGQVDSQINESIVQSYQIWREHIVSTILLYDPEQDREQLNLLAHIMVSMMVGASVQYLSNSQAFNLDAYFAACLDMIENFLS